MKYYHLLILGVLLSACNSFSEAGKVLRNEKVNTTDEFLVKKKQPLELPPEYNEIPLPNSKLKKNDNNQENIKKILKAPKQSEKKNNRSNSVENSILERIKGEQ